jgi:hypothetical protein
MRDRPPYATAGCLSFFTIAQPIFIFSFSQAPLLTPSFFAVGSSPHETSFFCIFLLFLGLSILEV